jgi:hypothetical protein
VVVIDQVAPAGDVTRSVPVGYTHDQGWNQLVTTTKMGNAPILKTVTTAVAPSLQTSAQQSFNNFTTSLLNSTQGMTTRFVTIPAPLGRTVQVKIKREFWILIEFGMKGCCCRGISIYLYIAYR